MQAEYVQYDLQVKALGRLREGRLNGQLVALDASMARWGSALQLHNATGKLKRLAERHNITALTDEEYACGMELLKARNIDK